MPGGEGMELPILDKGERIGSLSVTKEGLYTVFRAELPPREGLQRLWLYGAGAWFCLGLLAPTGKGLRLEKRLSRADCARLPRRPEYAALQPKREAKPEEAKEAENGVLWLFGRRFVRLRS